jgi:GNAT superfamily N-acetyltransferase
MSLEIQIRPASVGDKDFINSLVPRLTEFGPPPWRDAAEMAATDIGVLTDRLDNQPSGTAIFIAEDAKGARLGFIHLQTGSDYYIREEHGHIADVIVAPECEGRGVGRLLIERGEEWARSRGHRWLTLSVFAQNLRAREVYERLGYGADMIKYVKELG